MLKKLKQNACVVLYLKNSAWMMAEYAFKVLAAIFVTIYVARYLGPVDFGLLSYALAVVAISMAVSRLGMESILVRELSRFPGHRQAYMATAFFLMIFSAVVVFSSLAVAMYLFESDGDTRLYVWVMSIGIIFQSWLLIDYNFQSQVKAKYSSVAKSAAMCFGSVIKLVLVFMQADLLAFVVAFALDHFFIAFFLVCVHLKQRQPNFLKGCDFKLVRPLLKSAWPMVLAALGVALYMKIDQLMIKNMLGDEQLGFYSAATRIYDGWIIVPFVLSLSLLPAIVKLKKGNDKKYERNMVLLFSLLFWMGVFAAIIASFFGDQVIRLTFGAEFLPSAEVLGTVMWAAAFAALGTASARYLTVEGMEKKIAIRTFLGLVLNASLNFYLIPRCGIQGAAYATLITMLFANYLINYFDSGLGQLVRICNQAITLKWVFYGRDDLSP